MDNEFLVKWHTQVKKGLLSYVVLNIISKKSCYGLEIIKEVKAIVDINIAEGTLYPLLNRLKKGELVEAKWVEQGSGIPRKYYNLTKEGEQILIQMKEYWEEINQSISKLS
ncbi:MAG: PadR family transcriptional regulator [Bacteroidota bacterium]